MHHYSHKKGNSSLLSGSPFSYVTELVTESPLFIGYSWESYILKPLADCVKSALTFSKALLLRKRKNHSRISRPRTESATLALCVNSAPFNQPEQTGNCTISSALFSRGAHCERLSYILKQCAQTLANSFRRWGLDTVLPSGRGLKHTIERALSLSPHGCAGIATVNSVASLILRVTSLAPCWKTIKNFTIKKGTKCVCF